MQKIFLKKLCNLMEPQGTLNNLVMKININNIPLEGLTVEEKVSPSAFDLETDSVKFSGPIKIRAEVYKITNAVTVNLSLNGSILLNCSRCLREFNVALKKILRLNYQVDKSEPIIDLDQDIKEEIILDYPIKPLCNPDCKGLCPKCGQNLNEEKCSCTN